MAKSDDIKIRALPRGPAKKSVSETDKKPSRLIIYVGTSSFVFLAVMFYLPGPADVKKPNAPIVRGQANLPSASSMWNDPVNKHLQDAQIKHEMLVRRSELENLRMRTASQKSNSIDQMAITDSNINAGVQLDNEASAERIYEDLNEAATSENDLSPMDRINARLANRKWVGEFEQRERVQFIRSFIRSARDQGYEVEIDPNLVVVGVRKLNETRKVNVEEVLSNMASRGI